MRANRIFTQSCLASNGADRKSGLSWAIRLRAGTTQGFRDADLTKFAAGGELETNGEHFELN